MAPINKPDHYEQAQALHHIAHTKETLAHLPHFASLPCPTAISKASFHLLSAPPAVGSIQHPATRKVMLPV